MDDNGLSEVLHIISERKAEAWRQYNARQRVSAPMRYEEEDQGARRNSEQQQGANDFTIANSDFADALIIKTASNTVKVIAGLVLIFGVIKGCSS